MSIKARLLEPKPNKELLPIMVRQPAYCQTQCCVQPYVHTTRVKKTMVDNYRLVLWLSDLLHY